MIPSGSPVALRLGQPVTPRDVALELGQSVFGTTIEVYRMVIMDLMSVAGAQDRPAEPAGDASRTAASQISAELRSLRDSVVGIHGSLVATSDGLLVTHDIPDMEPTRIAAIVAATLGLASQATHATGRGGFREAVARGGTGYLVVYAAGANAVVAVLGDNELNVGMLHYEMRDMIGRIAGYSAEFARWDDLSALARSLNREP